MPAHDFRRHVLWCAQDLAYCVRMVDIVIVAYLYIAGCRIKEYVVVRDVSVTKSARVQREEAMSKMPAHVCKTPKGRFYTSSQVVDHRIESLVAQVHDVSESGRDMPDAFNKMQRPKKV